MHVRQCALFALAIVICGGMTARAQCPYALNAGGQAFTPAGGSGSIVITALQGCAWNVTGTPGWVTLMSSGTGTGNGTLTYQVAVNAVGDRSSGSIAIGGASFTVEQAAGVLPGLAFIGSIAHLAAEENWTTAFTIVNKDTNPALARLSFSGDAIDPGGNGALTLPLAFPQQSGGVAVTGVVARSHSSPECFIDCRHPGGAREPGADRFRSTGGYRGAGWVRHFPRDCDGSRSGGAA